MKPSIEHYRGFPLWCDLASVARALRCQVCEDARNRPIETMPNGYPAENRKKSMIAALKRLFAADSTIEEDPRRRLAMAGALLMLEVARADFSLDDSERSVLRQRLRSYFDGRGSDMDELIEQAMAQHDVSVSLHQQVDFINDRFDAAEKRELIRDLWLMAYADGELHHYEEAVIRRLAELLYVPHVAFIKTKLEVTGQA